MMHRAIDIDHSKLIADATHTAARAGMHIVGNVMHHPLIEGSIVVRERLESSADVIDIGGR